MKVSLRFEVLKRDRFTCVYCGNRPPDVVLHVDHIHPQAAGGLDDPSNLVTACSSCNLGKGDSLLPDAFRFEKAEEISKLDREANNELIQRVNSCLFYWMLQSSFYEDLDRGIEQDTPTRASLEYFATRITEEQFTRAVDATFERHAKTPLNNPIKYFYGICHNLVRDNVEKGDSDAPTKWA